MPLHTAGLVVVKNKKVLLAFSKNKQAFYLPGGKIDEGETPGAALIREVKEELDIDIPQNDLRYYMHITAPAYGEDHGIIMEQECYLYDLPNEPASNGEIEKLEYFDAQSYALQPAQVPGVIILIEQLKKDGLL